MDVPRSQIAPNLETGRVDRAVSHRFKRSEAYFKELQKSICYHLENLDGKEFVEDLWERVGGGGGRSRILTDGFVFEKAGVNFSQVSGEYPDDLARELPGEGKTFQATGLSLVIHPRNPKVPAVHANFRHLTQGESEWFGGGMDLTPYYLYREDCIHFHRALKRVCDRHPGVANYDRFKDQCDHYFYLEHRSETRGIGGLFFDYVDEDPDAVFEFVRDLGDHFLEAYLPIAQLRMEEVYTAEEREFQLIRRGRYVEFNLLYDRGTAYGLKTGGRIESILMSLPPAVRWPYNYSPRPGSREADLLRHLVPINWAYEEP